MNKNSLFLFVILIVSIFTWCGVSAVPNIYTYSLSLNFTHGCNAPQFQSELEKAGFRNNTVLNVTIVNDDVNIEFQYPLDYLQIRGLRSLAAWHTTTALINDFCADLPDAPTTITLEMVKLGVLVTQCTVARDYTFLTATEIVETREYNGKFVFMNDGSAAATIVMGTGGSTNHNMVVSANAVGQFMYATTNDITGSHAYMLFRVS